jgi:RNA polymerase sigma-70 factor (ECF subfamily)
VTPAASRFEEVTARHRAAIARICRHYEASAEARRDLEQEILVGLWRALATFRGESSEKTFVLRVAHNVAVTHVTRSARARQLDAAVTPPPASGAAPDAHVDAKAMLARLDRRLRAMDLVSQELVLLALEGCTTAEIAEVTGLSLTNVTTRLSRLRHALTQEEESP